MENKTQHGEPQSLEATYEPINIGVRGVWIAAAVLAATVVVALLLMAGLLRLLAAGEPVPTVVEAPERPLPLPPGVPAIEADQIAKLEQLRRFEGELLDSYAWVDEQDGIARIPIDRAMAILSVDGLPAAVEAPDGAALGESVPDASTETTPEMPEPSSQGTPNDEKDE